MSGSLRHCQTNWGARTLLAWLCLGSAASFMVVVMAMVGCTDGKTPSRVGTAVPQCNPEEDEGCRQGDDPEEGDATPDSPGATDEDWLKDVKPLQDAEAVKFFVDQCGDCHDSKIGSVKSFWPLDKETFGKELLVTDSMAPTVYMTLVMKAKDIIGGKPEAMPLREIDATERESLLRLVKWMEVELPAAASEGKIRFGDGTGGGVGVVLNFKCGEPASFRGYVRRFANDAFGREPTAAELALAGHDPDEKATPADRKLVAKRLFEDPAWNAEFIDKGLRKFAAKVSGANDLKAMPGLTEAQVQDLREEFYQLLKANWDAKSFREILLMNKVMVTANTAPLYEGCAAPATGWAACNLAPPRGSYFSTIGYLASKPSSFLRENNNYGRAALMHFVVRGDVFRAAFDQDGGAEEVRELPSCLKSKDFRGNKTGTQVAWRGASAIPSSANLCQSCHIERQMAAGSILFRPFNPAGLIYKAVVPANADAGFVQVNLDPEFVAATGPEIVNQIGLTGPEEVVDEAFLMNLLESSDEKACVPSRRDAPDLDLKGVDDLAKYLIGDGRVLAGGLARHLPRAMSNLAMTSEEIIVKVNQAFADGEGKLAPVFKAYFESETYGCKK